MQIALDDLTDPAVLAFLTDHVTQLRSLSPLESAHALDLDGLRAPDVRFWAARHDGELVGCAALTILEPGHGELTSMRAASHRTRQGVARRLLAHVLDEARLLGLARVSLETGGMSSSPRHGRCTPGKGSSRARRSAPTGPTRTACS